jgi:hypothetical protein
LRVVGGLNNFNAQSPLGVVEINIRRSRVGGGNDDLLCGRDVRDTQVDYPNHHKST